MVSSTSGAVLACGMISSSFNQRGGLKKCVPRKCSWNPALRPSAIAWIGRPEVLLETIQSGLRTVSMRSNRERLMARFSTITSTIQSTSASRPKSSSRLPSLTSFCDSWLSMEGGRALPAAFQPASTMRLRTALSLRVRPAFSSSGLSLSGTMSSTTVGIPTPASRAAIPLPMVPAPITAAFWIR